MTNEISMGFTTMSYTAGAISGPEVAYTAPELNLVFVGFLFLYFQCSVVRTMFVFAFCFVGMVLSVFLFNDLYRPFLFIHLIMEYEGRQKLPLA